jgi:hypothetical protein
VRLFYRYYLEYFGPFERPEQYKTAITVEIVVIGDPAQAFADQPVPVNQLLVIRPVTKGSVST